MAATESTTISVNRVLGKGIFRPHAPVRPPRVAVAVEAEGFALPLLLASAPGLNEVMFLGILGAAFETLREVRVGFPARTPLGDGHNLCSKTNMDGSKKKKKN